MARLGLSYITEGQVYNVTNLLVACVASSVLVVAAASALTGASYTSVTSMVVSLQTQHDGWTAAITDRESGFPAP